MNIKENGFCLHLYIGVPQVYLHKYTESILPKENWFLEQYKCGIYNLKQNIALILFWCSFKKMQNENDAKWGLNSIEMEIFSQKMKLQ